MRKFVKKIATLVASLTMVSAMGISALAAEPYSFMCNPNLVGEKNPENTDVGWQPHVEGQIMTAVEGMDGVYKFASTYVLSEDDATADDATKAARRQFKIIAEGPDMGWNYQMCIGNPDSVWGDNQTQWQIEGIEEGEFVVYVKPANGYACVIQNQKALDLLIRFHSRDEDPANFVEPTLANILAEGYAETDTGLVDADYEAFVAECVAAENGSGNTEAVQNTTENVTQENKNETPKTGDEVNAIVIMMVMLSVGLVIKTVGKKVIEN